MWLYLIAVIFLLLIWKLNNGNYKYWEERGVTQSKYIPILGDGYWYQIFGIQSIAERLEHEYKKFPNLRYFGVYDTMAPFFIVRDPDLIKQICVKDFDHFVDHPSYVPEGSDPLWTKNLIVLTGQQWKNMRMILSPSFTTSKMKQLFVLMTENAKEFTRYFADQNQNFVDLEIKDVFQRYTNDIIANTIFGVTCNSMVHKSNDFFVNGAKLTDFAGLKNLIKLILLFSFPKIAKFFNLSLLSKSAGEFFQGVVKESIAYREKNKVTRPDMMNLLLEARKDMKKYVSEESTFDIDEFSNVKEGLREEIKCSFTDEDITAQALIFFLAGFDQVSVMSSWMAYELALNPDVQKRLIEEIDETAKLNGELTYETLTKMTYMDMVLSESMRKWPVSILTDRICTKEYTIKAQNRDERDVVIEKGTTIWFPFYAMHRDPKIFEDPEKFEPERFSVENRKNINPYAFMPFGVGPRNCIGSRFALMEIKALFYYLLSEFEIAPNEKTDIPMTQAKTGVTLQAKNGFFLRLNKRTK